MSFQQDKNTLLEYVKKPDQERYNNDQELEHFFQFIDNLEEKAVENPQYFTLLADAYMIIGNAAKAQAAFSKKYNPKNKKDLKKLMYYKTAKTKPIVRPSKRPKELPPFRYVKKDLLKNSFIQSENCTCSICQKDFPALYIGMAYSDSSEQISCIEQEEKFCADCLYDGTAAQTYNLSFNFPELEECIALDSEKRKELLYKTPECCSAFDFHEDIWPSCCDDFCCYTEYDNTYEEIFHFQCLHCGKKFTWMKET